MRNKLITICLTTALLLPAYTFIWADTSKANTVKEETTVEIINEEVPVIYPLMEITVKYAKYPTFIYSRPDISSETYGESLTNTSFDVIAEKDGWSTILGENGCAYILTEALSKEPAKPYTEEELNILAHVIAGEAQHCDDMEQRYVGSIVLNRVKHKQFPNTIKEVVFQRGQYACTRDGNFYREPTEQNWANAKYLLEFGSILPEHVVFQSRGKQGSAVYTKTKWHYYCY